VSIGSVENGAFGLAVELAVNISDVSIEEAKRLTVRAHQVCPYSNATRNNVEIKLTTTNKST
jgi:organic hydroperoxide reductase OsmC/OhrA